MAENEGKAGFDGNRQGCRQNRQSRSLPTLSTWQATAAAVLVTQQIQLTEKHVEHSDNMLSRPFGAELGEGYDIHKHDGQLVVHFRLIGLPRR